MLHISLLGHVRKGNKKLLNIVDQFIYIMGELGNDNQLDELGLCFGIKLDFSAGSNEYW